MPQQNRRHASDLPPLPKRQHCAQAPKDKIISPPRVAPMRSGPSMPFLPEGIMEMLGLGGKPDSDRILILGLLLLLSGEECDRWLLMALMYILL